MISKAYLRGDSAGHFDLSEYARYNYPLDDNNGLTGIGLSAEILMENSNQHIIITESSPHFLIWEPEPYGQSKNAFISLILPCLNKSLGSA